MRIDADRTSFDNSSPVLAYWLANAEGLDVRAGRRRGVVEEVVRGPGGAALELVVRFPRGRRAIVAADEVDRVVPAEELLVLRTIDHPQAPSRLAPAAERAALLRGRGTAAIAHGSKRAAAFSWRVTDSGARVGWAASQRAAAATARASGRGRRVGWAAASAAGGAVGRGADRAGRVAWRAAVTASQGTWADARRMARWLAPRAAAAGRSAGAAADAAVEWLVAAVVAVAEWLRRSAPRAARTIASRSSATAAEARAWLADGDRAPTRAREIDGSQPEPEPDVAADANGRRRKRRQTV